MLNQEAKKKNRVFDIYGICIILIYVLPYLKVQIPYILAAFLFLLSFILMLYVDKDFFSFGCVLLISSLFFGLIFFAICRKSLTDSINEIIRNIRFFLPVLWMGYVIKDHDIKKHKIILIAFILITIYMLIKTIIQLEIDPEISRKLASGKTQDDAELRSIRLDNIGGFEFSYMMGLIHIACLYSAFHTNNRKLKTIFIVAIILSFYYIFSAQYTTLLILTFFCDITILLIKIKSISIRITLIIGILIFCVFLMPILNFIVRIFDGNIVSQKIQRIIDALKNNDVNELGNRPQLINIAINNWMQSPLWGGYYKQQNTHSMMFALLQNTGLIGFCIMCYLFYKSWKIISKALKEKKVDTKLFNVACVFVAILSFLNPINFVFEITIALYFIIPFWSILLMRGRRK